MPPHFLAANFKLAILSDLPSVCLPGLLYWQNVRILGFCTGSGPRDYETYSILKFKCKYERTGCMKSFKRPFSVNSVSA
jgi:hypothetical protein